MKHVFLTATALSITAGMTLAGGIDRAQTPYSILFTDGNYLQFNFATQYPSVDGDYPAALGGGNTGNMANPEAFFGAAIKFQLTDSLETALIMGQPYGADSQYNNGAYAGLVADWDSTDYQALLKYNINEQVSVYGGLRAISSRATIEIPNTVISAATGIPLALAPNFEAGGDEVMDFGYVLGAAYEIPEIAARLAVTYRSEIEHAFDTTESFTNALGTAEFDSTTKVRMPQSVTIDFQTGVAENTLVFGSARWTEWSVWEVRTQQFDAATGSEVVGFDNDIWTFSLGAGQRINEDFSVFAAVGYEDQKGGTASRLAPTDGFTSITVGGSLAIGQMDLRAGITHAWLGDAEDSTDVQFEDNQSTGVGFTLGFGF